MTRFLAFGGVRFVLAGALAFALAVCFVGRAEAASVFSSSFAAPAVFANSAAPGARVVVGDRALTLSWSAVKGAAGYRVSWRGRVLKGGKPTAAWSKKWLGLKVLKASARSHKASGLVNGSEYQLRLESNTKAKKSRWVVKSTLVGFPSVASCANGRGVCLVGETGPGGGKVFYAPGGTFTETGAPCGSSCRYLEAAPAGWNAGGSPDPDLQWGHGDSSTAGQCRRKDIPGAAGTGIGSGFANTTAIMAACPSTDPLNAQSAPAALTASTYAPTVNGVVVTGWFLPSIDELNRLDGSAVGGLDDFEYYWSSSQYSSLYPYTQAVGAGTGVAGSRRNDVDKGEYDHVRVVRAF